MRHGTANRRPRGRGHGHNNGQGNGNRRGTYNRNQIFDSNGPDVRIRGTAHQVCEKYLALAKDAQATGDIVQAENYLQHAEHYQRIINTWNEESPQQPRQQEAYVPQQQEDDLSLPMSVLGGEVKVSDERTVNARDEEQVLEAV
jgi:hypothetical protein